MLLRDLQPADREAVESAIALFTDKKSDLYEWLPKRFEHKYTSTFLQQYFAMFLAVRDRLHSEPPDEYVLRCTADELAFYAIIEEAKLLLLATSERLGSKKSAREITDGLDSFYEDVVEDTDIMLLYDDSLDGYETDTNLDINEWFTPFR